MAVNLFLVESPFQALCALEFSLLHPEDNHNILCRLSGDAARSRNNKQLLDIVQHGNWNEKIDFVAPVGLKGLSSHLAVSGLMKKLKKRYEREVDCLLIGEFRARWMHQARLAIKPNETWLIDDGAASRRAIEIMRDRLRFLPEEVLTCNGLLKHFIFLCVYRSYELYLSKLEDQPLSVFSVFLSRSEVGNYVINGVPVEYRRNTFREVKKYFASKQSKDCEGFIPEVYYYGSKYSEAGIISSDYELRFLQQVKRYYEARGLTVRYFPHRDESVKKLKNVERLFPGKVMHDVPPAEIYLLTASNKPKGIAAAYSSLLTSLSVIFPELPKTSFMLAESEVAGEYRQPVMDCYKFLKESNLEVITF